MGEEERHSPMEELVFTGYLPLPFGVDLEVNALNKVSRHNRSLRWDNVVVIDKKWGTAAIWASWVQSKLDGQRAV